MICIKCGKTMDKKFIKTCITCRNSDFIIVNKVRKIRNLDKIRESRDIKINNIIDV